LEVYGDLCVGLRMGYFLENDWSLWDWVSLVCWVSGGFLWAIKGVKCAALAWVPISSLKVASFEVLLSNLCFLSSFAYISCSTFFISSLASPFLLFGLYYFCYLFFPVTRL
jgi:hypothetical protein